MKVSQQVAKLERERDAAVRALADKGPGPQRDVVTFVGGPYDLTRRALVKSDIDRGEYRVAVANPRPFTDYTDGDTDYITTGTYRIARVQTGGFYEPWLVAVWEGVR